MHRRSLATSPTLRSWALPLAVAGLLLLAPAAQAEESLTVTELAARVQETYQATTDLAANFEQVYHFQVTGRSKKSSGRLFIKLPGKMRWDYLQPEPKHFVADGRTLWVVAPQDRQVLEQPVEQSEIASVFGFLLGSADLRTQFDLSLLGRDAAGRYRLKLTPKKEETHYRQVVLLVDPVSFRTVGTEVTDPAGNLNTLTFTELKVNQGLPDSGFSFQVPAGFRVIQAAGSASPASTSAAQP